MCDLGWVWPGMDVAVVVMGCVSVYMGRYGYGWWWWMGVSGVGMLSSGGGGGGGGHLIIYSVGLRGVIAPS